VFWVISVYFNIRNILLKSGTFLLGHPVYNFPELLKCNSYAVCLVKLCPVWLLKFELCILQTHMQYKLLILLSFI